MNGKPECDCGCTPRRGNDERLETGRDPEHGRRDAGNASAARGRGTLFGLAWAAFAAGWTHGRWCPQAAKDAQARERALACFAAWIEERLGQRLGSGEAADVPTPSDAETQAAIEAFDLWLWRQSRSTLGRSS